MILVFESFAILLTGCVMRNFDISYLRYFIPFHCQTVKYIITLKAKKFEGISVKTDKTVDAVYESKNGQRVELKSAQFGNSFDMHAFWHAWARKNFSLSRALESEWWWFEGKISKENVTAWYEGKTVFILVSKNAKLRNEIEKELKIFIKTFSGVRS